MLPVHSKLDIVRHSQMLLASYRHWTGNSLIEPNVDALQAANALFEAPIAVLSHGVEADPILNYGNQTALRLWEMEWDEFTRFPSRQTAEAMDQEERARFLDAVGKRGFIDRYRGIRIAKGGRRFRIENAIVWNLVDEQGSYRGQAASFDRWEFL